MQIIFIIIIIILNASRRNKISNIIYTKYILQNGAVYVLIISITLHMDFYHKRIDELSVKKLFKGRNQHDNQFLFGNETKSIYIEKS